MQLFFSSEIHDGNGILSPDESRHAVKVLRLNMNDEIHVIDGKGGFFKAVITVPNAKKCVFQITEQLPDPGQTNYSLHIAIAPTKNIDRLEWFLEKATEIGISEITPILCQRSERKVIKPERLEKVLLSAMKQSFKAQLPRLNPLVSYQQFIETSSAQQKLVAHCNPGEKEPLKNAYTPSKDVLILIGPEGDFSENEVALAKENGFHEISLGKSRLRTETAAIVACHTINLVNE